MSRIARAQSAIPQQGASMSESISTTCVQGGYRPGDGEPRHLEVRHERAHGPPVRPRGGRVLLHASGEPHERLRGGQNRRARGRHGGHAHVVGPGCELLRRVQHRRRGRSCRSQLGHLRRHVQPAGRDHEAHGPGMHVRFARLHRRGAGGRVPAEHEGRVRRDTRTGCR